jgi:hypothetical protein
VGAEKAVTRSKADDDQGILCKTGRSSVTPAELIEKQKEKDESQCEDM